jgi:hypothetical protein
MTNLIEKMKPGAPAVADVAAWQGHQRLAECQPLRQACTINTFWAATIEVWTSF